MKTGVAKMAFNERGVIQIAKVTRDGQAIDKDRAEEIAIEAGAEEILEEEVQEDAEQEQQENASQEDEASVQSAWTLYTSADEFNVVRGKIEGMKDVEILDAAIRYLPIVQVPLNQEDMTAATSLVQTLQELEDVSNVYDNIKQ